MKQLQEQISKYKESQEELIKQVFISYPQINSFKPCMSHIYPVIEEINGEEFPFHYDHFPLIQRKLTSNPSLSEEAKTWLVQVNLSLTDALAIMEAISVMGTLDYMKTYQRKDYV